MDALEWTEAIAAVIVSVIVLPLIGMFARRRWLARGGGAFECGLRLHADAAPGAGWVLGAARYRGEMLEWYRIFSASLSPRVALARPATRVLRTRDPDPVESVLLYDGQQIVELDSEGRQWDLAMSPDATTALLSWLEAAPPGQRDYL